MIGRLFKSFSPLSVAGILSGFVSVSALVHFFDYSSVHASDDSAESITSVKETDKYFRVAIQDSVPKYVGSSITARSEGLCNRIYAEIGRRIQDKGVTVKSVTTATSIVRILRGMDIGRVDGFCGAGRNKGRESKYLFSKHPVFYNNIVMVTHRNNKNLPKSFSDIEQSGDVVMAFYGTTGASRLKKTTKIQVDDRFMSLIQPLRLIASQKRHKYFYYHELGVAYLIRQNKLPLKLLQLDDNLLPQWMAYSQKIDPDVLKIVEQAIDDMARDGTLKDIAAQFKVY